MMLVVFISANRARVLRLFFHMFMLNVLINITTTAAASHPFNKPADFINGIIRNHSRPA